MHLSWLRPTGSMVAVVVALIIGLEAPAMAHQANVVAHKISGSTIKANTITGKQVKESTLSTVPSAKAAATATVATTAKTLPLLVWHSLDPDLANSWADGDTNANEENRALAYAVDAQGVVHLEGVLTDGPSQLPSQAIVLPAAIAVPASVAIPIETFTAAGYPGSVVIQGDKLLVEQSPENSSAAVASFTSLEGITYDPRG